MQILRSTVLMLMVCMISMSLSGAALSQSEPGTGQVKVVVKDRDGVIPKASVTVTNLDTSRTVSGLTDKQGQVSWDNLVPGSYVVHVEFSGFADFVKDDLNLAAGKQEIIEAMMTLAQFSDTITVTTTNRRVELLRDVAEPTTVIDRAEVEDTGARTAKDVLSEQAGTGVLVSTGGGQGHVSINGVPNSGVLILVDGRRLLGKNGIGDVNLEDLDMNQFERVEIVKGAGSALYGSDALGGVINFISRRPRDFGIGNQLNFDYGSYKDTNINDTFSIRKGGFSGVVHGGYRYYEGFDLDPDNPQTIGQPESKFYTFSTNLEQRVNDRVTLRGFVDYNKRKIDNYYFSGATQMGTEVYNSKRDITRWNVSPEADFFLTDSTQLNVRYTYSRYDREEIQEYEDRVEDVPPWREYNSELSFTGRQTWNFLDLEQMLQMGYENRHEKMDRANLLVDGQSEADRSINVFWAQNEFRLIEQLRITLGFRYDNYSDFGSEFSPKVSAMYDITKAHGLRFSYGHGFRAPNFGELYLDLGSFFRGNPDLEPEKSDNFTFGYIFSNQLVNASVDYFHNRVKDGIVFDFSGFPFSPITYTNLRQYTAKGVNSGLTVNLPYGFAPSVAYTYIKREDPDGVEVRNYPKNSAFFKILWANPRYGIRANLRAQFNGLVEYDDGTYQPAYQLWSFQVRKNIFETASYFVSIYGQVDNLFDEQDIFLRDATGEPIPGEFQIWNAPRTVRFGLSFDLKSF